MNNSTIDDYFKNTNSMYDVFLITIQTSKNEYNVEYNINKFYDKKYVDNLLDIHARFFEELNSENNKIYRDFNYISENFSEVQRISEIIPEFSVNLFRQTQKISSTIQSWKKGYISTKSEYTSEILQRKNDINRFSNIKYIFERGENLSQILLKEDIDARNSYILDTKTQILKLQRIQSNIVFGYDNRINFINKYIKKICELYKFIFQKELKY